MVSQGVFIEDTANKMTYFLNYCVTQPEKKNRYVCSGVFLQIYSNTPYLTNTKLHSCIINLLFFVPNTDP